MAISNNHFNDYRVGNINCNRVIFLSNGFPKKDPVTLQISPPPDILKFNVDGDTRGKLALIVIGGALFNDSGTPMKWNCWQSRKHIGSLVDGNKELLL